MRRVLAALVLCLAASAAMDADTTGAAFPTGGTSVDRAGATAWTSPGNIVSDNATDTQCAVPCDYLIAAFDFNISATATVTGVTVAVEAGESGSGNSNYIPQLCSDTTPTLIGSAKGAVTVNNTTKVVSSNGGSSDVWGATLTPAIVNAAGFCVAIWSTDASNTLFIDYVTMAIDYTLPATMNPASIVPVRGGTSQTVRMVRRAR